MMKMIAKPPCCFIAVIMIVLMAGCSSEPHEWNIEPPSVVSITKKDDSTSCMYWKCSATKKLYMQKYVKDWSGTYRSAGAFPLDKGIGAFPLKDLDKYKRDSDVLISITNGNYDVCPYCSNTVLG